MLQAPDAALINDDLAPTPASARTWTAWDLASLWIGMVVCVPTYMLAGGLVDLGMSWWQAVLTVGLGNVIVLVPMILDAQPGTRYGIPFPVLARASFGIRGANIPAVLRGLVACGWFGIQTWIGGNTIYQLLGLGAGTARPDLPLLGINLAELLCFLAFWADPGDHPVEGHGLAQDVRALGRSLPDRDGRRPPLLGVEPRRRLGADAVGAVAVRAGRRQGGAVLQGLRAGGHRHGRLLGDAFAQHPRFLALRPLAARPDPGPGARPAVFMMAFSFLGVAVTSTTVIIFGEPIADPIVLLGKLEGGIAVVLALLALSVATLSTNLAANVVSPANAIVNLAPKRLTFRTGSMITAGLGLAIFPWKLIESTQGYIFTWLVGYSGLLGPIGGVILADYYWVRRMKLDLDGLYRHQGPYTYRSGYNPLAIVRPHRRHPAQRAGLPAHRRLRRQRCRRSSTPSTPTPSSSASRSPAGSTDCCRSGRRPETKDQGFQISPNDRSRAAAIKASSSRRPLLRSSFRIGAASATLFSARARSTTPSVPRRATPSEVAARRASRSSMIAVAPRCRASVRTADSPQPRLHCSTSGKPRRRPGRRRSRIREPGGQDLLADRPGFRWQPRAEGPTSGPALRKAPAGRSSPR